jgi:hypothetical protein
MSAAPLSAFGPPPLRRPTGPRALPSLAAGILVLAILAVGDFPAISLVSAYSPSATSGSTVAAAAVPPLRHFTAAARAAPYISGSRQVSLGELRPLSTPLPGTLAAERQAVSRDPPTAPSPLVDLLIDAVIMAVALVLGGGISIPRAAGRRDPLGSLPPLGGAPHFAACASAAEVPGNPGADTASGDGAPPTPETTAQVPWWRRLLGRLRFWRSVDKADLVKLGAFVLLSYGCVSNLFMAVCFSLSWYVHCKQFPGLFPLAAGQRGKFLLIYAGFYSINNLLRPIRVSLSIALAPYFERAVRGIQRVTGLGRRSASVVLVILVNVIGTTSLLVLGASLASLLASLSVAAPVP